MSRRAPRSRNALRIARILAVFAAVLAVSVSTVTPLSAASATTVTAGVGAVQPVRAVGDIAASGLAKTTLVGFNAGNIISDAVFTKKSTMTEAQIQTFLNSKVKTCRSGYTCLKDLKTATQSKAADKYCSAYAGAKSESAARIIYKVAQACGINPQVLIVMLQKEQGLVTHTWPSDWRYNAAMGQACPDTAPCNVAFAGFFAQVYGAARQMQIYMDGVHFTWYAPGKTWNVLYHPNASCGRGAVKIANKATSALYYYTPYQPNAASLAAGYGTGNSCSSYGNRNFYNYFTDWFGSTQSAEPSFAVTGVIAKEWERLGGEDGQLGGPQMKAAWVTVAGGGYYQRFEKGYIWWKSGATEAFGMANGPFLENYKTAGAERGAWGWPASQAACGLTGGGCKMTFQNGVTYYSAATQSQLIPAALVDAYVKIGAENSALGYPSSSAISATDGRMQQDFAKGTGVYAKATGLLALTGELAAAWKSIGGLSSSLGMPKSAPAAVAANGSGQVLELAKGTIWASAAGGFVMGYGPFRTNYLAAGGPTGAWGWPASAAKCGLTGGGCYMAFQNGTVGYSVATGSVLMSKAVATEWLRVDPRSIGYPKTSATSKSGGTVQEFTAGTIWSSGAGAFAMGNGPLRTSYLKSGGPTGTWGWPAGPAKCGLTGGGCYMAFQKGTIGYSTATGSVLMSAAVTAEWLRVDPKSIGYPKSAAKSVTGGTTQEFTAGTIYSSTAGSFAMGYGPLRNAYVASGGPGGSWGWPTTGASCGLVQKGCTLGFQKGLVAYTASTGSRLIPTGGVLDEWTRLGGVTSKLGYPTSAAVTQGTLTTQSFQGGKIAYDSSTKKVTVS